MQLLTTSWVVQDARFAHSVYYLRSEKRTGPSGRFHAYSFTDPAGQALLEAHVPEIPKDVLWFAPNKPDDLLLRLKAWRWFWWNGRYDVLAPGEPAPLGTLRRTGGIEDAHGRAIGRVRNAASWRSTSLQTLVVGVLDCVFGQSNSTSSIAVDAFHVLAGGREAGRLSRTKLPFLQASTSTDTNRSGWRGWLAGLRSRLRKRFAPGGWQLDFTSTPAAGLDRRVLLAAALFRIHIEERYR